MLAIPVIAEQHPDGLRDALQSPKRADRLAGNVEGDGDGPEQSRDVKAEAVQDRAAGSGYRGVIVPFCV